MTADIGDCPAVGLPTEEGGCGALAANRCADFKKTMKPHVAQSAVACLKKLSPAEQCDPKRVDLCAHNALMNACDDSSAESVTKTCDSVVNACPGASKTECTLALSGLREIGRESLLDCARAHCADKGIVGREGAGPGNSRAPPRKLPSRIGLGCPLGARSREAGASWGPALERDWCQRRPAMDEADIKPLYLVCFGAATTLVMLVALLLGRRTLATELTKGNIAQRLLAVGEVTAIFLVASNAVKSTVDGTSIVHDIMWVSAFGLAGVVLIAVMGRLGVQLLLSSRLPKEIARRQRRRVVAAGAHYVAIGIITSHAMGGNDLPSLGVSCVFFVIGQLTLHIFVSLFRALTTYDDAEQIAGENLAAALSYSGAAIAIAIIIARATEGDFTGWASSLKDYGGMIACCVALYPVRQLFVQVLLLARAAEAFLRRPDRSRHRGGKRSAGLGALEAVTYIATALSISRLA